MSRGRRARFPVAVDDNAVGEPPILQIKPRRFVVRADGGKEVLVDLTSWSHPALASEVALLLREQIRRMGPTPISRSIRRRVLALQRFWTFLDEQGASLKAVSDITVSLINGYEDWLEQNAGGRLHQRHLMATLISLLRLAVELKTDILPADVLARLTYLGHGEAGGSRPRDAYSSGVAASLRKAARSQVDEASRRIAPIGKIPAEISGLDVGKRLRKHYAAVVDEICKSGRIERRHPIYQRFEVLAAFWNIRPRPKVETIHAGFHLTRLDLVGFIVLLSLETGMEMECLHGLKADCLRNPTKGYVEIEYYKRRARGSEWKRLRVRDGGSSTPGGLIRLAIALTERARKHLGTDRLWVIWTAAGLRAPREEGPSGLDQFAARHGVVDDDGQRLKLRLSLLRKTQKAEWYKRTGGQLEIFAVGHSIGVAARHYADIPALRHIHEQALSEAFHDALDAALRPTIVLPEMDEAGEADPAACIGSVTHEVIDVAVSDEQDVWLAICGGFYESPFGSSGDACPTPFWGCLECSNAVITARKLPALIAFQSFMLEQRDKLDSSDWHRKFGRAWHRVTKQILPSFPEAVVQSARLEASASKGSLVYLPPEASAI
ncbi:hypothetical protein [Mesorhizobium sp.]|uniref:hypothetical protein n=1 Tax=Mesorhizobium sp. TaxID=1871066 RepID=UPI000FE4B75D|nr:hypothetical protein [Mesorhizobium sp.]RWD43462.1 MAG: hypothetical protein EOS35_20875 [Mesorhizobium sp.]